MSQIETTYIEDEMRESYINYAMSVILGRAIPEVRDGLKPVQRRILYGMYKLGLSSGKPHRKAARIVGEVMGKYHPHGDQAIYDTLVNMGQSFSCRYSLIDGQGNFGSIDGDEPAAMRYTEARLSALSEELLEDIEEDTVDFSPNFDDSLEEPSILPAKVPNLLLNGSWGISVGMTTQIPPHNLGEVVDATIHLIDNPEATLREVLSYIKGPDFPTGGIILGREEIERAYRTGNGRIRIRAKAEIEDERILITEIPYQVRKSAIVESIAQKVRSGEMREITDLRDESDREGLRIVIELKRSANPLVMLNRLYKYTSLEWTFGANLLVIVDGHPRKLSLLGMLREFIHHRREVVRRRTEHRLKEAERRAHILEGFRLVLQNRRDAVEMISSTKDTEEAVTKLNKEFGLSELQAQEILKMRLRQFTGMEQERLAQEYEEKQRNIKEYREILESPVRLDETIKLELEQLKEKYSDSRRTVIMSDVEEEEIDYEASVPEQDLLVSITEHGYANAPREDVYKKQNRGGKGVIGMRLRKGDRLAAIFTANSHDHILLFTDAHKVYKLRAFRLPSLRRDSRGENLRGLLELDREEKICALLALKELDSADQRYCLIATEKGIVNRNRVHEYHNAHTKGIIALRSNLLKGGAGEMQSQGQGIVSVAISEGEGDLILGSAEGQTIRFKESRARCTARPSRGVIGMRLNQGDKLIGMVVINPKDREDKLLLVTENGYGKRSFLKEFHQQGRGGKGILGIKVDSKTGKVIAMKKVRAKDEVMIITKKGKIIRISTDEIRIVSRYAKGVKLIDLDKGDKVASVVKVLRSTSCN